MIDRDIHLARALLVESNALLRSVAAAQLRDLGIGQVSQAGRVTDARLLLERERFDIVICSREFEGENVTGQDLLDELRRENQLPHSTVFLMVMAQASYHQVVEAAEAALDGFLVRPYTAAQLAERLTEARNRKRELNDVLRALDAGEQQVALVRAVKRFQEQQPYWGYCGRLAAEIFMSIGRPTDAARIFELLAQAHNGATWARLGVARAQIAAGDQHKARQTVAQVLQADRRAADAHDLMGRLLVDQCDFDAALDHYRSATELTPGCLLRAQHAGALAFYQCRGDEALKLLERTLTLGVQSKLFDALTLLLVAMLRHDRGDTVGTTTMREQLRRYCSRFPDSLRLRRLEEAATVLVALRDGSHDTALTRLKALSATAGDDDFDLEFANMLLALWARVPEAVRPADDHHAVVERIALRFSVSKAIGEVLLGAAARAEPAAGVIRDCQARISTVSERAMDQALKGDPQAAVQLLLTQGQKTLNAKLLETAGLMARRYQAALPDAEDCVTRAQATLKRSSQGTNHIAGIQRSGRSPGGLQLRGATPAPSPSNKDTVTADAAA